LHSPPEKKARTSFFLTVHKTEFILLLDTKRRESLVILTIVLPLSPLGLREKSTYKKRERKNCVEQTQGLNLPFSNDGMKDEGIEVKAEQER
jgi:hypothetical protein